MSRSTRIALGALGVLALLLVSTVAYAAVVTWQAGTIRVRVEDHRENGADVAFVLPAVALDAALAIVPDLAKAEIRLDAQAARGLEFVRAAGAVLGDQPDFVLVDVRGPGESVRVEKKGGALCVAVESRDESVRIEIPLTSIRKVADWLGRSVEVPGTSA